jgi:uncharacterized DUF497 family protein
MAEEFGNALRAVQEARVNHSESVDLTERDSDSRMELLGRIPRIKMLKRVHMPVQTLIRGVSQRLLSRVWHPT